MDSEVPRSGATTDSADAGQSGGGHATYRFQECGPNDVMFDQLEYLVNHADEKCSSQCRDCARLEQVRHWLLLPFRTTPGPGAGS